MFGGFATNVKTTGYELTGDLGKCLRMGGLTFYKDFTKSGSLDADFALGSRKATYTSTSGVPTIGANGYAATTANVDVLKYAISGNRTAAQETIVIKFTPTGDFANDGVNRFLTDTNTKGRRIMKSNASANTQFYPNADDSLSSTISTNISVLDNTNYILGMAVQHISPYITAYNNGSSVGTPETSDDFTTNAWGTSFYLGASNAGAAQINGSIAWVKIFNRPLTAAEVALIV